MGHIDAVTRGEDMSTRITAITVQEATRLQINTLKNASWKISTCETADECRAFIASMIAELEAKQ